MMCASVQYRQSSTVKIADVTLSIAKFMKNWPLDMCLYSDHYN